MNMSPASIDNSGNSLVNTGGPILIRESVLNTGGPIFRRKSAI